MLRAVGAALMLVSIGGTALAASTKLNPPWNGLPMETSIHPHSGAADPINIALEGSKSTIVADFGKLGWVVADPLSLRNDLHLAEATLHHGSYTHAPVSTLYLFGRKEDFAVEHQMGWVGRRDHARFWDAGRTDPSTHLELWLGSVSRDIGVKVVFTHHHPSGTSHVVDGNLDAERNLLVSEFRSAGVLVAETAEPGMGQTSHGMTAGNSRFFTDGKADVVELK